MMTSTPFRNLLHAANLRHGTNGFTSPLNEGVLRIFLPLKIWWLRPGLNPWTWVQKASTLPLDHRCCFYACWSKNIIHMYLAIHMCHHTSYNCSLQCCLSCFYLFVRNHSKQSNNKIVCLFLLWQHKQLHCGSVEVTIVKILIRCNTSDLNNFYDYSQIQHPSQKE